MRNFVRNSKKAADVTLLINIMNLKFRMKFLMLFQKK